MKRYQFLGVWIGMGLLVLVGWKCAPPATATPGAPTDAPAEGLERIQLPEGFQIQIFADRVKNARSMVRGDQGTLFVGSRSADQIYAIVDRDGDWRADTIYVLAEGMRSPNGVAFRNGSLFVAEINRVLRWDDIESRLDDPGPPVVVNDAFPNERHHGWKYIAFGPDDKLYVPVGAPCNVCDHPEDPRFSSIMRMDPDGQNLEVYAHGIRNSVGFAWHPQTQELWFTDNGRDWMGDNGPTDELNHAPRADMHFGFPYCHAGETPDPEYGSGHDCGDYTAPAQKLGPHVAALGMKFYQGKMFPKQYRGSIFIAEHGSWNRSDKIGYRITRVPLENGKAAGYEVFAEGWLHQGRTWGRPVDLLEMPDGSLLVSDDYGNRIYRISYQK